MAYRCRNDKNWTMEFVSEGTHNLTGYSPEHLIGNKKISYADLIDPADRVNVWEQVQTALNENRVFQISYRINTPDGQKWVWEQGQGVTNEEGNTVAVEGFITDITERMLAQQNLEKAVDERTHELSTLLDISHDLASTLKLEPLLSTILDQLRSVVEYDAASIMILSENILKVMAYRGPIPLDEALQIQFFTHEARANNEVIKQRTPIIVKDIHEEQALALAIRAAAGDELESTYSYLRCWMGIPLIVKDMVVGMLTLDHREPNHYTSNQANLALAFANQAAVAIENARLYQETERRADESEALYSVQKAIASHLEMDDVLQMIADEGRRLTKTDISAVYILEGDELVISYVSGDVPENILGYRLAVEKSIAGRVIKNRESILVPDTWADPRVDRTASDQVQARSLLIVPLISGGEPIGTITVANRNPGGFDPNDEALLSKLAANVVISLENARLYQAEFDRRQVAESMSDIVAVLNSSQSLQETLNFIADRASLVMESEASIIHKIDYDQSFVSIEASHGLPAELQAVPGFPLHSSPKADSRILNKEPFWVPDLQQQAPLTEEELAGLDPDLRSWRMTTNRYYRSWLAVPLVIGDEVYGSLAFYFISVKDFDQEEIQLASAFADQAALAIENTRLYEAAEMAAITAERNRLARDLHDAVTQTLFSASVIADVLPRIWERDADEGHRRLEELRQLTRGALSEMRTLLVELRPAALIDTKISDLIGHQVNAFKARTRLQLEYSHSCDFDPPPEVKEAFYRITQEAFNNIAKHSDASTARVSLDCRAEIARLTIEDDGVGFELEAARAEGLGMNIMEERARNANAHLDIHTKYQQGTQLKVTWQVPDDNKEQTID